MLPILLKDIIRLEYIVAFPWNAQVYLNSNIVVQYIDPHWQLCELCGQWELVDNYTFRLVNITNYFLPQLKGVCSKCQF